MTMMDKWRARRQIRGQQKRQPKLPFLAARAGISHGAAGDQPRR